MGKSTSQKSGMPAQAVVVPPSQEPRHLRSDQFKQAILDAIPEQIAVLSSDGRIVESNAAWNRLVGTPRGAMNRICENANYLGLCRTAVSHDSGEMRALVEGIRSILCGDASAFTLEYRRSNRREGDRWFVANATQLAGGGAVIIHNDVTERKILERELISISEYERRQIGKDLHDGLCQVLGGMMLTSAVIASSLKRQNSPEAAEVSNLVELARDATNQARELSRSLHPVDLDAQGLSAALQELASRASTHLKCTFTCEKEIELADANAALSLYRIAQESLANALRHARAQTVALSLGFRRKHLILKIEDDGIGISSENSAANGMGIQMMRYRASAMGARLQIRRREGKGTRVSCILAPVEPKTKTADTHKS